MQNSAKSPSELKLDGDNAAERNFFVQKLNIYLQATKAEKETEEYKGAVLLNCVGDKALKIYNTFKSESESNLHNEEDEAQEESHDRIKEDVIELSSDNFL
jgi:hypothetical protein